MKEKNKVISFFKRIKIKSSDNLIQEVEEAISQYKKHQITTRRPDGVRSPFEKYQREREEYIKTETIEMVVKVAEMLDGNLTMAKISKETGFSIEQVKMIQRLIRNEL